MSSAGSIRMLKGHVEIGGDLNPLQRALALAKQKLNSWGNSLASAGRSMLQTGLSMAAPMAAGVAQFATYEQALADLRAAANPTAEQFARVKEQIDAVALSTGTMPAEVANAYSELLKAGVPLEKLLSGLGETTIKFARVSGMGMAQTAIILSDSMNAFGKDGIDAARAANIMNQAADASTISLSEVAMSFARGGSVAASFGQNMNDVATAVAIMGNKGIKGAMAGDALKTLLTRLATGAGEAGEASDECGKAIQELGLQTRDSEGKLLKLPQLIANIERAMAGKSQADQDRLKKGLGGMRGLLSLTALLSGGSAAFAEMQQTMTSSLTVEQKFAIMTDTLQGAFKRLMVQLSFVGIAVGEHLAPALRIAGDVFGPILAAVRIFAAENKALVQTVAGIAAGLVVVGGTLWLVGTAVTAFVGTAAALAVAFKFGLILAGLAAVGYAVYQLVSYFPSVGAYLGEVFSGIGAGFAEMGRVFSLAWGGIRDAIAAGDLSLAFEIGVTALKLVWAKFGNWLADTWGVIGHGIHSAFATVVNAISGGMIGMTRFLLGNVAATVDAMIGLVNRAIDAMPEWARNAAGVGRIEFDAGAAVNEALDRVGEAVHMAGPGALQPVDRGDEAALQRQLQGLNRRAATQRLEGDNAAWFRSQYDALQAEIANLPGPDLALDQQMENLLGNAAMVGVTLPPHQVAGARPALPPPGALGAVAGASADRWGASVGGFLGRSISGYAAVSPIEKVANNTGRTADAAEAQVELLRNQQPGLQVI